MQSIKKEVRDHTTWLQQYKGGSRTQAERAWQYWKQYMEDKDEQWILNNQHTEDWAQHLVNFRRWLSKKPKQRGRGTLSDNATKTMTALVRGYLQHIGASLSLSKTQKRELIKVESRPNIDYPLNLRVKEQLIRVADPVENYIVCAGVSFGLRISDFLRITRGMLEPLLDNEVPIQLPEMQTGKEGVPAYPFIDRDAYDAIKELLEIMNREGRTDSDELMFKLGTENPGHEANAILKDLFDKAQIPTGDYVARFHILRKFLTDQLASVCVEDKWKHFVGKKTRSPYVSAEGIEAYKKVMQFTCVNGDRIRGPDAKVREMEQRLVELKGQMMTLESKMATLVVENKGYKEDLAQLKKQFQTLLEIAGYQEKKLSEYKQNNETDPL